MIRRTTNPVLALLCVAVLAACSGPAASSGVSQPPAASSGVSQPPAASSATSQPAAGSPSTPAETGIKAPLEDGFPNQTITILVVDDPGSIDDLYAKAYQRALKAISPVRINVIARPDFGTFGNFDAAVWLGQQPGGNDGYIMAVITDPGTSMDLLTTPVGKELGVGVTIMNRVIATEFQPHGLYSRKDAPWGDSFEAFVEYGRAHPGELKYIGRGPGSGLDTAVTDYLDQLGIEAQFVVGGSFVEIGAIVASGQGDFAFVGAEVVKQFYDDGRIEVLALSGEQPFEPWTDKPTIKSVTGQEVDPWPRKIGFFVAEAVPDTHRDWLYELIRQASEDPTLRAERVRIPGVQFISWDHDQYETASRDALARGYELFDSLDLLDPTVTQDTIK